jgi:uncharacterized membrane protein
LADLEPHLLDWVQAGLIEPAQADRIREAESHRPAGSPALRARPRESLAAEAIGYAGGALVVVAVCVLAARRWDEAPWALRTTLLLAASLGLALIGALVAPSSPRASRLRAVLWVLSSGAFAGTLGVTGASGLDLSEESTAVLAFGGAAAHAFIAWSRHRTILTQAAAFAALAATAAAATVKLESDALSGVAVWGVGVCWVLLALGGVVRPVRIASVLGAATAVLGAAITEGWSAGIVFAVCTALAVLMLAVATGDLALLAVGALGSIVVLPAMIHRWFTGTAAAGVLLLLGLGLLGVATLVARQGKDRESRPAVAIPGPSALAAAAVVAVVVVAAVLLIGTV